VSFRSSQVGTLLRGIKRDKRPKLQTTGLPFATPPNLIYQLGGE